MSVRKCLVDYFMERTCMYICALLCFYHVKFYVLIIMSVSVRRHELWCTVRDLRLGKCSIIIIIYMLILPKMFIDYLQMSLFKDIREY